MMNDDGVIHINCKYGLPVLDIKMIEDKLLHNVNICRGLIQIVHMVKVNLKSVHLEHFMQ